MVAIKLATLDKCEEIQNVFNHKDIIAHLGGFTMLQNLKDRCKPGAPGLWYAELEGKIVGAMMAAGRPQSHLMKYGEVATLPEHQRKGIASAMYLALTLQGVQEGRRLFEDTIVGDNPTQFHVLPKLGIIQAGTLRHRTASGKDICLFQLSLWDEVAPEAMMKRLEKTGYTIEVLSNYYTDDLWTKNLEILGKHPKMASLADKMKVLKQLAYDHKQVSVHRLEGNPTDVRRAKFRQQTILE